MLLYQLHKLSVKADRPALMRTSLLSGLSNGIDGDAGDEETGAEHDSRIFVIQ
jgi:hypothetical protein